MADSTKIKKNNVEMEAVYEALALADNAWTHFNFAPELVATALKLVEKEKLTLTEAKSIVKAFSERKVT